MIALSLRRAIGASAPMLALALAMPSLASAQATRTWVSGVGDDANPCSRTAPCKTFAGAISKTATGGEINVLDPGGFGAVTITKSITIDGGHFISGVLVSGTNGIIINAPTTARVTLRHLDIDGLGTGLSGVKVLEAGTVRIEHTQIYGFTTAGVESAISTTGQHRISIRDSDIYGNTGPGVKVASTTANAPMRVTINRTDIDDNGDGIVADSTTGRAKITVLRSGISDNGSTSATPPNQGAGIVSIGTNSEVRIGSTDITGNLIGLQSTSGGAILSLGNNQLFANGVNGAPTGSIPLV